MKKDAEQPERYVDFDTARAEREAKFRETYRLWMKEAPQRIIQSASGLSADQLRDFLRLLTLEGYRDLYQYVIDQYAEAGAAAQDKAGAFLRKGVDMQTKVGEGNRRTIEQAAEVLMRNRSRPYASLNQLAVDIARQTGLSKSTVRSHLAALGTRVDQ
ncbi:hypothetical protein [Burkholderia anthina]|uniref:hypothetical protein n=1 Tax=Burkholderia anthina TaxID=179879 RepID=UPI00158D2502|nr:hypothetical protein [Burkholderia anthina]